MKYSLIALNPITNKVILMGIFKSIKHAKEAAEKQEHLVYDRLEDVDFSLGSLSWLADTDELTSAYAESMLTVFTYHIQEYENNA